MQIKVKLSWTTENLPRQANIRLQAFVEVTSDLRPAWATFSNSTTAKAMGTIANTADQSTVRTNGDWLTHSLMLPFLQEKHSTLCLAKENLAGSAVHLVVFPAFLFTKPVSLRASHIKLEWLSHSVSRGPVLRVCSGSDWLDGVCDWLLAAPVPSCCFQSAVMEPRKFHAYKGVQPWIVCRLEDLPGCGSRQLVLVNYSQSCGGVIKDAGVVQWLEAPVDYGYFPLILYFILSLVVVSMFRH